MASDAIVETNWIMDVCLGRDSGSARMWELVQGRKLQLGLPMMCLAESVKALESLDDGWRRASEQLKLTTSDAQRAVILNDDVRALDEALLAIARMRDRADAVFWPIASEIGRKLELLNVNGDVVALAGEIRSFLKLTPADSMVLATVVIAQMNGMCHTFVSRDKKAFENDDVAVYMKEQGITFYSDPMRFLRDSSLE